MALPVSATAVPPTFRAPVAAVLPPGQAMEYSPGFKLMVNEPDSPATRFSFSPRMREPERTSNSLTRPVPALVTLNSVGPASSFSDAGSQPASVSLIATCLAPADPALLSSSEPHATSSRAAEVRTMAARAAFFMRCSLEGFLRAGIKT